MISPFPVDSKMATLKRRVVDVSYRPTPQYGLRVSSTYGKSAVRATTLRQSERVLPGSQIREQVRAECHGTYVPGHAGVTDVAPAQNQKNQNRSFRVPPCL